MHSVFKRNYFVLLVFLSFLIRLSAFVFIIDHPERTFTFPDSDYYDRLAQNLIKYHRFSAGTGEEDAGFMLLSFAHESRSYDRGLIPDSVRTPVYPAYLALIYWIFGRKIPLVIFFQTVISLLTFIIVYKISSSVFNETVGIIAFILISLDLGFITFPNYVLTEILFIFLKMVSIWFLVNFLKTKKKAYILFSALLGGLSTLCRPINLYFPLVVILILLVKNKGDLRKFFVYAFTYISIFLLVLSPWWVRNYLVFGHARICSVQGVGLYLVDVAFLEAEKNSTYWEDEKKKLADEIQKIVDEQQLNSMEASIIMEKLAKERLLNEPFIYLRVHLRGMAQLFMGHHLKNLYSLITGKPYQSGSALSVFYETGNVKEALSAFIKAWNPTSVALLVIMLLRVGLYGFLLYGSYKAMRTCPWALALFLLTIGYFTAIVGAGGGAPRLRIPIIPFLDILSSYGIFEFMKKLGIFKGLVDERGPQLFS